MDNGLMTTFAVPSHVVRPHVRWKACMKGLSQRGTFLHSHKCMYVLGRRNVRVPFSTYCQYAWCWWHLRSATLNSFCILFVWCLDVTLKLPSYLQGPYGSDTFVIKCPWRPCLDSIVLFEVVWMPSCCQVYISRWHVDGGPFSAQMWVLAAVCSSASASVVSYSDFVAFSVVVDRAWWPSHLSQLVSWAFPVDLLSPVVEIFLLFVSGTHFHSLSAHRRSTSLGFQLVITSSH